MIERAARGQVGAVRWRSWRWPAVVLVLALAAAAAPLVVARDDVINLLFRIWLFVALAQSWNMLAGFTGQTSLGHAAFFGIGALVTRTIWLGGAPFAIALILGG